MNGAFVHSVGHDPCKVEKSDHNRYAPPYARLAQLAERFVYTEEVSSSNLLVRIIDSHSKQTLSVSWVQLPSYAIA